MQKLTETSRANGLDLMKRYVQNRQKTYDLFARLDANSKHTSDAKALLEAAQRHLEEFVQSAGSEPNDTGTSEGGSVD